MRRSSARRSRSANHDDKERRTWITPSMVLRALLFLCVILLFLSYRYQKDISFIKTMVGSMITPMQKGINTMGTYISGRLSVLQDKMDLLLENERLTAENESIKMINSYLTTNLFEKDDYLLLYQEGMKYEDFPKVYANVISNDSNNYYSIFTINKGNDDGIMVDMNVFAENGLCGIIVEVGKNYSKVRTIIDDYSYVSGMFQRTGDTCDVKGDVELLHTGYIRVEAISKNALVYENDEVVTSNISDKYLPGIRIGYVSQIEIDASDMSMRALLRPAVDFEHIKKVIVITELKKPLEPLDDINSYESILDRASRLPRGDVGNLIINLQEMMSQGVLTD